MFEFSQLLAQAIAELGILFDGHANLTRLTGHANVNTVGRAAGGVGDCALPIQRDEVARLWFLVVDGLPFQVTKTFEPLIDSQHRFGRTESMIRSDEHASIVSRQGDQIANEAIKLTEISETQLPHGLLQWRGIFRQIRLIEESPTAMLQLVDAVEHDRRQIGRSIAHQVLGDVEPVFLADHVEANPRF